MRFKSHQHVKKRYEFSRLKDQGKKINCSVFLFIWVKRPSEASEFKVGGKPFTGARLGLVTSRKVGNAVKRNYARRLFREIFREQQLTFPDLVDVIIIVRNSFEKASFQELQTKFAWAVQRMTVELAKAEPKE